jgi:hypothetical protein
MWLSWPWGKALDQYFLASHFGASVWSFSSKFVRLAKNRMVFGNVVIKNLTLSSAHLPNLLKIYII